VVIQISGSTRVLDYYSFANHSNLGSGSSINIGSSSDYSNMDLSIKTYSVTSAAYLSIRENDPGIITSVNFYTNRYKSTEDIGYGTYTVGQCLGIENNVGTISIIN
jgi:hypothetical protein